MVGQGCIQCGGLMEDNTPQPCYRCVGQVKRKPGRPAKDNDASLHIQIQESDKAKLNAICEDLKLSYGEVVTKLIRAASIEHEAKEKREYERLKAKYESKILSANTET